MKQKLVARHQRRMLRFAACCRWESRVAQATTGEDSSVLLLFFSPLRLLSPSLRALLCVCVRAVRSALRVRARCALLGLRTAPVRLCVCVCVCFSLWRRCSACALPCLLCVRACSALPLLFCVRTCAPYRRGHWAAGFQFGEGLSPAACNSNLFLSKIRTLYCSISDLSKIISFKVFVGFATHLICCALYDKSRGPPPLYLFFYLLNFAYNNSSNPHKFQQRKHPIEKCQPPSKNFIEYYQSIAHSK